VSEKDIQSVSVFMANKCAGRFFCLSVVCCRLVNDVTCFTFVNVSCCTVLYFVTHPVSGFCNFCNSEEFKIILKFVPLTFCVPYVFSEYAACSVRLKLIRYVYKSSINGEID